MLSSFHAYYIARALFELSYGKYKFLPVFASSDINIYPYQIAATEFALRSPQLYLIQSFFIRDIFVNLKTMENFLIE